VPLVGMNLSFNGSGNGDSDTGSYGALSSARDAEKRAYESLRKLTKHETLETSCRTRRPRTTS
jgi:hypothetical protein